MLTSTAGLVRYFRWPRPRTAPTSRWSSPAAPTTPPGLGRIGNAFVGSLRNKVGGRSVGAYAVNYPASFDFLAAAGGANDASGHIQWMVDNCPNTCLVLGGYSQGAAVIDVIAAVPFPAVGFNAPLPPNVPEHVAAVAVFGNPSAKLGLPLHLQPGLRRPRHRLVQPR